MSYVLQFGGLSIRDVSTSSTRTAVSHNQFLQIHPASYKFSADRSAPLSPFISSPSLFCQEIPFGEDFQSTGMAAFLIRRLWPAQNGSRWTTSLFNGGQLTFVKSEHMRRCIVSGDQLEST